MAPSKNELEKSLLLQKTRKVIQSISGVISEFQLKKIVGASLLSLLFQYNAVGQTNAILQLATIHIMIQLVYFLLRILETHSTHIFNSKSLLYTMTNSIIIHI